VRRLAISAAVLVVVIGFLVVIDLLAKGFVEGRVEEEFTSGTQLQVEDASFAIDSFPFTGRLLAFGEVSATLELDGIQDRGVTIDRFTLDVDGLVFDRLSAFQGEVQATGLDRATASLELGASAISDVVGLPVEIRDDGTVTAGGATIQASIDGNDLTLAGEGFAPVSVPLNLRRYLPCAPEAEVLDGLVRLSCSTDQLPRIVNRVLGEVGAGA
jgi:hypothetical protein